MRNPWLDIPLTDYEGHMGAPGVAQAPMLCDQLEAAVQQHAQRSVAVIGCAGGNGFEKLRGATVNRVVGIDINPAYVEAARRRFAAHIPELELYVADIQKTLQQIAPVELVFAALILEYVELAPAMKTFRTLCETGGNLVIILQAPSPDLTEISPSSFKNIQLLAPIIRIRDVADVQAGAIAAGFSPYSCNTLTLLSGKSFVVLSFRG